jgi:hypothetical protein
VAEKGHKDQFPQLRRLGADLEEKHGIISRAAKGDSMRQSGRGLTPAAIEKRRPDLQSARDHYFGAMRQPLFGIVSVTERLTGQ